MQFVYHIRFPTKYVEYTKMKINCTFITPITTLSQYSMSCPHYINVSEGCNNHEQLKSNRLLTEVKNIGVLYTDLNDKST